MHQRSFLLGLVPGLAAAGAMALIAFGPLNPPAGPVASTLKPLAEIEPRIAVNSTNTPGTATTTYRITQPGSYYLAGNVAGVSGRHGIEVAASNVTIDLNGFEVAGAPGSLNGVFISGAFHRVSIRNGTIRSWGDAGIRCGSSARGGNHENLLLDGNVTWGYTALNVSHARFTNCTATSNQSGGFQSGTLARFLGCSAQDNAGAGFSLSAACVAEQCSAHSNTIGFQTAAACVFHSCTAMFNSATGISASTSSRVENCVANNNATGISTGAGVLVSRCDSYSNSSVGIDLASGSTADTCTVRNNSVTGIRLTDDGVIRNCTLSSNGDANILVTADDNRIEGNACAGADRGIHVTGTGNIIIRNTSSGAATNWVIVANNYYAAIVDKVGGLTAAVNGNSGGSQLSTTDANANFSY